MAERARILVVDDEPLNLDLLRRTLQRDFDVAVASSAAEAVTWLDAEAGAVAVVLCDQLMPGRSGSRSASFSARCGFIRCGVSHHRMSGW